MKQKIKAARLRLLLLMGNCNGCSYSKASYESSENSRKMRYCRDQCDNFRKMNAASKEMEHLQREYRKGLSVKK